MPRPFTCPDRSALWELAGEVREALVASHDPDGFNIGVNDGVPEKAVYWEWE